MIRVVCKIAGFGPDGTHVSDTFKVFEVDAPELETWIREEPPGYTVRSVIGIWISADNGLLWVYSAEHRVWIANTETVHPWGREQATYQVRDSQQFRRDAGLRALPRTI